MPREPPYTEPYVRWCGSREGLTPPGYPILIAHGPVRVWIAGRYAAGAHREPRLDAVWTSGATHKGR